MADIVNIVAKPFFETRVTAPPVDLCIAGDAWTNRVSDVVPAVFFPEFPGEFGAFGSGADKTHFAAENIPQLRQFVETAAAQEISDAGAPRIPRHRPDGAEVAFGILVHCPEFDHREAASIESDAHLPVQDRAAVR